MPYRTRNGRRIQLPARATNGVQYLVSLDGTVATFECAECHARTRHDYGKGPVARRIGETGLKLMAHYWQKGTGHCYGWCQKCQNKADGV